MSYSENLQLITEVTRNFSLFLLQDMLDESLVVMKHVFGWDWNDILYLSPVNVGDYSVSRINNPEHPKEKQRKKLYQELSVFDYVLYEEGKKVLESQMRRIGGFEGKLKEFRQLKLNFSAFCHSNKTEKWKQNTTNMRLPGHTFSGEHCCFFKMSLKSIINKFITS